MPCQSWSLFVINVNAKATMSKTNAPIAKPQDQLSSHATEKEIYVLLYYYTYMLLYIYTPLRNLLRK